MKKEQALLKDNVKGHRPADASRLLDMESIADLDVGLLSEVLIAGGHSTGPITDVQIKAIGQGLLGSSHRLQLTYAAGATGLPAIVLKMHGEVPSARKLARYGNRVGDYYGFYGNEVTFYHQLAPNLTIRVPHCYAAGINEEGSRFVLLLEPIEPATIGDDLKPCSVHQLELAVTNIAGLHGPTWGLDAEDLDPRIYNARGPHSSKLQSHFIQACNINVDRWKGEFTQEEFEAAFRFAHFYDEWQRAEGRPRGIVHTDHRMDNLLFFDDRDEVVVVDWQTIQLGMPVRDVGQLFAASISTELRRAEEDRMMRLYHEALHKNGVADYPFDRLMDDYRWSLLQGLHGALFGLATITLEGRGKELFLTKARRTLVALRDHRDNMPFDVFAS